MIRLLPFLWIAFKVWMYIDVSKRRVADHWRWIVLLVPGGAVAYFFMIRLRAPDAQNLTRRLTSQLKGPPDVSKLQYDFDTTPSLQNRIRLGQGLFDNEKYGDARTHFEEALKQDPENAEALHGLGVAFLEMEEPQKAKPPLLKLLEVAQQYRDFIGYADAADACWRCGNQTAALEIVETLCVRSPRLQHLVLKAQYLENLGRTTEARGVLEKAIQDDRYEPSHIRRMNRPWLKQAKRMLEPRS